MSENIDFALLKRRIAELEDGNLLPLSSGPEARSEPTASMDVGHTVNEKSLTVIKTDLRYLRSRVATLDGAMAALRERTAGLPSKHFIAGAYLTSLVMFSVLVIVIFQSEIQAFLRITR